MIEKLTLAPLVTLRCCRDSRFKQGCLSIQLVRTMKEEESAKNALLPSVLLRGTERCPDLRAITDALDLLYGASVSPLVRRVGDYQTTGLYCGFMDDRFALPGDQVLEPTLAFLEELLLDSPTENGGFLPAFVESEKRNLIAAIEAERNDKRIYAANQLLQAMGREDTFGLPRMGRKEQVERIDPVELMEHYRTILRTSPIEIFYVGSADSNRVARLLQPLLARLDRCPVPLLPQTPFHPGPREDLTEALDVTQGKLCMGFTTPITNRHPDYAAMHLMETVFGGGMTSKLFQNVRERLSLCYFVSSSYYSTKGVLVVSAGIDFDKEERTRQEILTQLEACVQGRITEEELTAARESVLNGLRATHDSPNSIEGFYATRMLCGVDLNLADYMDAIRAVTLEDVIRAAASVKLQTTYFLKGARK